MQRDLPVGLHFSFLLLDELMQNQANYLSFLRSHFAFLIHLHVPPFQNIWGHVAEDKSTSELEI